MEKINISTMPIEIVAVGSQGGCEWVDLNIGNIPSKIIEPNPGYVGVGVVPLFSRDIRNYDWEELISVVSEGVHLDGCTDDPRLVKIAEMILTGRITELQPGTIIPPLSE